VLWQPISLTLLDDSRNFRKITVQLDELKPSVQVKWFDAKKTLLHRVILGVLKNAAVPAPERLRVYALKRFAAQARRQVVPSWPCSRTPSYAPPAQVAAAFPSRGLRTDWTGPFGQTQGMLFEHSLIFFVWLSVTHMWINRKNIAIIQQPLTWIA
jgi:hypothetical protein